MGKNFLTPLVRILTEFNTSYNYFSLTSILTKVFLIETQNHKLYDGEITESKLLSKKLQKRKSRKPRLSEPKPFNDFLYKNAKMGLF